MQTARVQVVLMGALLAACGTSNDAALFDETASGGASATSDGALPPGGSGGGAATEGDLSAATSTTNDSGVGGADLASTVTASSAGTAGVGGAGGVGSSAMGDGGTTSGSGGVGAAQGSGGTGAGSGTGGVAGTGGIPIDGGIEFREVCEFTPCGGDLDGNDYEYVGACMEQSVLLGQLDSCAGLDLLDASGTVEGTVSFDDGDLEQDVTLSMTATYWVPAECLRQSSCTLTSLALQASGFDRADCQEGADDGCDCSVVFTSSSEASSSYTTNEDQLTMGESAVSYCASEGVLQFTNGVDDFQYVLQAALL